ncbi:hypothetical protein [Amycolatopsis sp. NBC_01480]|uniref:hypothetical protein n=1 Tax=Amycolatopsis sp. NBC_01480 TaxID=2903562 RepID=UPI002E2A7758|nr:hypothetical protein [Amycolatopsis sp. NBC_01480]
MNNFLARRRRLPAEPSSAELDAGRRWLRRHGVEVDRPTRLLSIRIAAHLAPGTWLRTFPVYAVLAVVGTLAYLSLEWLPGVRREEMTESVPMFFIYAAIQVGLWRARRLRERNLVELVPHPLTGVARPTGVVDGWYVATAAVTFAGGAALAVSMFAAGARTYAWSWLGLLAVGAICTGVVLRSTLRQPVLAEDDGSLAADGLLRREAILASTPAIYSVPVIFDVINEGRQPHAFTGLIVGYVALCLALQAAVIIAQQRRKLPPGHYGTTETAPVPVTTTGDNVWKPPATD